MASRGRGNTVDKTGPKNLLGQQAQMASELRLSKDLDNLAEEFRKINPKQKPFELVKKDNMMDFVVRIKPNSGDFAGYNFDFLFCVPNQFPYRPPKVLCLTKIWHPNIDEEGNVCLSTLRGESYLASTTIGSHCVALDFLLKNLNPADPLNNDVADEMNDPDTKANFPIHVKEYCQKYCPKDSDPFTMPSKEILDFLHQE